MLTFAPPAPALRQTRGFIGDHLRGLFAVGAAVVGGVIGANVVAFIMAEVLHKPLSWFSVELSCVALYGPAALTGLSSCSLVMFTTEPSHSGALISQLFVPAVREKTVFTALLIAQTGLAFLIQALGVGSAALFFLSGLPLCFALLLNYLVVPNPEVSLLAYAVGQAIPLSTGVQLAVAILDVFVPLVSYVRYTHYLNYPS